jgi:hypothetical protein
MIQYRQSRGAKLLTVNGKLTHKKILDKHQIALYNVITAKKQMPSETEGAYVEV